MSRGFCPDGGPAALRWAELQRGRGIPPEILAGVETSPWRHDPAHFSAPAEPADTPSRRAATDLLGPAGGTVLDVGCGGGAAGLALLPAARHITGTDHDPRMLEAFAEACVARGVGHRTVLGEWPSTAVEAGEADVVVCHHVGYNTVEIAPFLSALTTAARRGVVMELTAAHPMAWLDPLWERFHGLRRPRPATVDDAVAVLVEIGITPDVRRWERPARGPEDPAWVARRLCLPPERADEVVEALAELSPRPRTAATLRW